MTKQEFLQRLNRLLADVTQEEREEALRYYEEYFDEAGPEQEQAVLAELGSPEKVAAIIKANVPGSRIPPRYQTQGAGQAAGAAAGAAQYANPPQYPGAAQKNDNRTLFWVVVVAAAILLSPLWLSVLGTVLGILAALGLLIPGVVLCVLGMVTGGVWSDAFSRNNLISGTKPMWGWDWHWGRSTAASVAVDDPSRTLSGSDDWQLPHKTGDVQRLDFTVEVGRLELTLGDDFALNTDGCDDVLVDSSKKDGVWTLTVRLEHNHSHDHGSEDVVEVVLPRDAWYDAVELECSAGSITGEELACGNLEVDVQAGSVQLRRVQADSMDLSAAAGSVDVSGTVNGEAKIEVNAGSVTLRTPQPEQYGYAMECNMGQVELFGDVSSSLYKRVVENEDLRPFFDLEVNTGKAAVRADDTL